MSKIKKLKFMFIMVLLIATSVPAIGSTFTDESWIAAYYFKKTLTPQEKYLPFVYVRDHNHPFKNNVGACIRTIEADFILMQQFPLYKLVNNNYEEGLESKEIIHKVFSNIVTAEEYISKVYQLAAFTVFQEEISEKYAIIDSFYPHEFYYRFYHFYISEYETFGVTLKQDYHPRNTKYSSKINDLRSQYLYGTYQKPLDKIPYEIPDSIIATDRINGLMPIQAQEYIYMYDSPLISAEKTILDVETKSEIGINNVKSAYSIEIFAHTVDKAHIDRIQEFAGAFTVEVLNYIKGIFADEYGMINTDHITGETLRDYLMTNRP